MYRGFNHVPRNGFVHLLVDQGVRHKNPKVRGGGVAHLLALDREKCEFRAGKKFLY